MTNYFKNIWKDQQVYLVVFMKTMQGPFTNYYCLAKYKLFVNLKKKNEKKKYAQVLRFKPWLGYLG